MKQPASERGFLKDGHVIMLSLIGYTQNKQIIQPRWLIGLRRSYVHSLMIARQSLCPEKLGSNPGQIVKGLISRKQTKKAH